MADGDAVDEKQEHWEVIYGDDVAGIGGERITSCFLAKIATVFEGRNAWHSTWSEGSFRDSIYPVWFDAVGWIENRRRRGSTWGIIEIPAIAFAGADNAVMIAEVNKFGIGPTHCPLMNFIKRKPISPTLKEVIGLSPPSFSEVKIWCSRSRTAPSQLQFLV